MILDYLDEQETPHLTKKDRMILLIYLLGITNRDQLQIISGWTTTQIKDTLQHIRKQEKTDKKRDEWLMFWQAKSGESMLYRLGQVGLEHALALRDEHAGQGRKKKRPHKKGQWAHFLAVNDVLCRLIQNNINFHDFLTGKEVLSYLNRETRVLEYNESNLLQPEKRSHLPFRPDGMIMLDEHKSFYLEADTGSETETRLTSKLENYVTGYTNAATNDQTDILHPVVWTVPTERRKQTIIRWCNHYYKKHIESGLLSGVSYPKMYCFVAGEETEFFAGIRLDEPFWEGS